MTVALYKAPNRISDANPRVGVTRQTPTTVGNSVEITCRNISGSLALELHQVVLVQCFGLALNEMCAGDVANNVAAKSSKIPKDLVRPRRNVLIWK